MNYAKSFIFMGDINKDSDHGKTQQFCSLFDLKSTIKKEPCIITKTHKPTIDFILTNKPPSFQISIVIETHKLAATLVKSHFTRLDSKTVYYRNFQNFDENSLLHDQKETNFVLSTNDPNENYRFITDTLI